MKHKLSTEARSLLRGVIKVLKDTPKLYNQLRDTVGSAGEGADDDSIYRPRHDCNSPQCIMGWASVLYYRKRKKRFDDSDTLIDRGVFTADQYWNLYAVYNWPDQFKPKRYTGDVDPATAIKRIEHFIASGGTK